MPQTPTPRIHQSHQTYHLNTTERSEDEQIQATDPHRLTLSKQRLPIAVTSPIQSEI